MKTIIKGSSVTTILTLIVLMVIYFSVNIFTNVTITVGIYSIFILSLTIFVGALLGHCVVARMMYLVHKKLLKRARIEYYIFIFLFFFMCTIGTILLIKEIF